MKQILHPLDNLIDDDRLFLMEALIPFVDYKLKAPLAMYIKINELMCILRTLQSPANLDICGMNRDIHNQDDILDALSGCGFPDIANQFSQMKKMSAMMEMMNMMSSQDGENTDNGYDNMNDYNMADNHVENGYSSNEYEPDEYAPDNYDPDGHASGSLYDNIINILNESEEM